MTTEEDQTPATSSLPYKKFDNDDAGDDALSGPGSGSGSSKGSSSTIDTRDDPQERAPSAPAVVDVPLNDAPATNGGAGYRGQEVALHMNGLPEAQGIRPPEVYTGPTVQPPPFSSAASGTTEEWTWTNLILSVCSIFCCTVCGILATVTSLLAYIDHRVNDFEAAKKKRFASYALALTALISGVVCMIIVVAVAISYDRKSP